MIRPVNEKYRISQTFGVNKDFYKHLYIVLDGVRFYLEGHNGIDYAVPVGTPVLAPHSGVVKERRNDTDGYGQYLKIENEQMGSVLGHLSEFAVNINQTVEEGQVVGFSGNTGWSTGPHLHWGWYLLPRDRKNGYFGYINQSPHIVTNTEGGDQPVNYREFLNMKLPEDIKKEYNLHAYKDEFNNNEDTAGSLIEKFKQFVTRFNTTNELLEVEREAYKNTVDKLQKDLLEAKTKGENSATHENNWNTCKRELDKAETQLANLRERAEKCELNAPKLVATIDKLTKEKQNLNDEVERQKIKIADLISNLTWADIIDAIKAKVSPKGGAVTNE